MAEGATGVPLLLQLKDGFRDRDRVQDPLSFTPIELNQQLIWGVAVRLGAPSLAWRRFVQNIR